MKLTPLLLITVIIMAMACNNDKKNGSQSLAGTAAGLAEDTSGLEKKLTALQQLTPYTIEEMKSLIPEEVNGDSATNITAQNSMGTGFASADYKLSDTSSVSLNVFDCAGNAGAGIYNAQFANLMNSYNDEYTKIFDFKGGKAIEHDDRRRNNYSLTYIAHDRLLVTLEGKNTGIDDLKEMAGKLKLK